MKKQIDFTGTISCDALRPQDFIRAFHDVLEEYWPEKAKSLADEFGDCPPGSEGEFWYITELEYALDEIAPDGHRFETGDCGDFGFWPCDKSLADEGEKHLFTKWVNYERLAPSFRDSGPLVEEYNGIPIEYECGATIEVPDAIVSDQLRANGLHVMKFGHRPEWYGLCVADHQLVPLTVEVSSEDICFAGIDTMSAELRVRKLKVLD